MHQLLAVLDASPMASSVSRAQGAELATRDFAAQAAAADVLKNNQLIATAARTQQLATPLLDVCHGLYGTTVAAGHGKSDMVAILHAIESRTEAKRNGPTAVLLHRAIPRDLGRKIVRQRSTPSDA